MTDLIADGGEERVAYGARQEEVVGESLERNQAALAVKHGSMKQSKNASLTERLDKPLRRLKLYAISP